MTVSGEERRDVHAWEEEKGIVEGRGNHWPCSMSARVGEG